MWRTCSIIVVTSLFLSVKAIHSEAIQRYELSLDDQALLDQFLFSDDSAIQELDPLFSQESTYRLFYDPSVPNQERLQQLENTGFTPIDGKLHICTHNLLTSIVLKTPRILSNDAVHSTLSPLQTSLNLQRVIRARELRTVVKEHELESFVLVPKKWWYHLPGRPWDLHDKNYLVIAERLILKPKDARHDITNDQISAILSLMLLCGLIDVKPENVWFTTDNKLALIDTEPRSLLDRLKTPPEEYDSLLYEEFATSLQAFAECCEDAPFLMQLLDELSIELFYCLKDNLALLQILPHVQPEIWPLFL